MHWASLLRAIGSPGAAASAFVYTISSNTENAYIDSTELTNNGWGGSEPVTIVVSSGVYCWSDNSDPGLDVDVLGATLTIQVDGYVIGRGGDGGNTSSDSPGDAGNTALRVAQSCTITGSGYIAGGGGGGGGCYLSGSKDTSYGGGGGGAGGGVGGSPSGGSGGTVGSAGGDSSLFNGGNGGGAGGSGGLGDFGGAGGGGGGRIVPGTGGARVSLADGTGSGAGGSAGDPGGDAYKADTYNDMAIGGGGGGWGADGGDGADAGANETNSTAVGGAGGKAVEPNGNTITWDWTGTYYGAIT